MFYYKALHLAQVEKNYEMLIGFFKESQQDYLEEIHDFVEEFEETKSLDFFQHNSNTEQIGVLESGTSTLRLWENFKVSCRDTEIENFIYIIDCIAGESIETFSGPEVGE